MEKVLLGSRVNRLGISRVSVAEGSKCRVVLLDRDPRMKHVSYDEELKRSVEVDQDMCIQYGLRPYPTFYYLIAKLNTDLQGRVIGDQFTVEYLQLSENLNNELADAIQEQGIPKSLSLTKVKKTGEGGRDFSYIKVTPSANDPLAENQSLATKITDLRNNSEFLESCWKMIDAATTISKEKYLELKGLENNQSKPESAKKPEITFESSAPKEIPGDDFSAVNDFGDGDDDFMK